MAVTPVFPDFRSGSFCNKYISFIKSALISGLVLFTSPVVGDALPATEILLNLMADKAKVLVKEKIAESGMSLPITAGGMALVIRSPTAYG